MRDLYIVQWLLANTKEPNSVIPWQRNESSGYFAYINEGENRVRVDLASVKFRPAVLVVIKLSSKGQGEVSIQEPLQKVFSLRRRVYDTEDENELAETMTRLLETVSGQLAQKDLKDKDTEEERKQEIFHRLISRNTTNL